MNTSVESQHGCSRHEESEGTGLRAGRAVRRVIDAAHPLFYYAGYGGTGEQRRAYLECAWRLFPPAARECLALTGAPDREIVSYANSRGIPFLVAADHGGRLDEALFAEFPNLLGVLGGEYPERFGGVGLPRLARALGPRGGVVHWQFLFNFGRLFDRDPRTYDFYRAWRDNIVLEIKANGFPEWWNVAEDGAERHGRFVHYAEVMLGAWLTGAAGNWGYHPEQWQWFEFGNYTRLFDYSVPGTRFRYELVDAGMYNTAFHNIGYCNYPENLMAQQVLNMAIHGCAVFSFEHGLVWDYERLSPMDEHSLLPLLDEIARRRLIPSREEVRARVRAATWVPTPMGPETNRPGAFWPNSFRKLYATTSVVMQNDGRYGLIPCLPRHTPAAERRKFECFPGGYHYHYLPFLNAIYPEEAQGACFTTRLDRRWHIINPYENVDREADFDLPLRHNTCSRLTGRLASHSLAIVEEWPDRLEIYLSNYRVNKDVFWDRHAELLAGDGLGDMDGRLRKGRTPEEAREIARAAWAECQAAVNARPRMADARVTSLCLVGHDGPGGPTLQIDGHEGFRHEERWSPEEKRYVLTVEHNGVIRLTLRAAGGFRDKRLPETLSANLALDRPAAASSALNGFPPELAVDGLTDTGWRPAGAGPHWLAVDLGARAVVSACKVVGEAAGLDAELLFQVGESGSGPWTTVREGRVTGAFFRVFPVDTGGSARWARLLVRSAAGFCLHEFGVYSGPNAELKEWEPLVEPGSLKNLIALLGRAGSAAEFDAIRAAATDFCARAADRATCVEELVAALCGAGAAAAATLVRILGRLGGATALAAIHGAAAEPRGEVREAAHWALVAWPDSESLHDVLAIARSARDLSLRAAALRWLLPILRADRLATEQRDRLLTEGLTLATESQDRLAYTEALRGVSCPEALRAIVTALNDDDRGAWLVRPARTACVEIAERIWASHPEDVRVALARVLDGPHDPPDPEAMRRARAVLDRLVPGAGRPAHPPVPGRDAAVDSGMGATPSAPGIRWTAYPPVADPFVESATAGIESLAGGVESCLVLPASLRDRRGSGVWVRFEGLLRIEAQGEYEFIMKSDGVAALRLQGRELLRSASGSDGAARIRLAAGDHRVTLVYEIGPLAFMRLQWIPPGAGEATDDALYRTEPAGLTPIPAEAIRHRPPANMKGHRI